MAFRLDDFRADSCTYNIFKPESLELEISKECATFAGFIEFLNGHIRARADKPEAKKKPTQHYICEQVAQVDMMRLLDCALGKLLELPETNSSRDIASFRREVSQQQAPLDMRVRQPFIVSSDSKKVCSIDSASPLDPFRLKRNLKGKKIPNEKKNVDAQLFENKAQARRCLEETKRYFNYMSQPIQPVAMDLSSMMHATTRVPNIGHVVFLLLCDPCTVARSLARVGAGAAAEGEPDRCTKRRKNDMAPSANDIRQSSYIKSVYQNIRKKKKIFKAPSIGSIMFSDDSIIMSSVSFINWFNSNMAAISN